MEEQYKKPTREEIKQQCFEYLDAASKHMQEMQFNFCCFVDRFKQIVNGTDGAG